jgi:CHAT domain-containing protein
MGMCTPPSWEPVTIAVSVPPSAGCAELMWEAISTTSRPTLASAVARRVNDEVATLSELFDKSTVLTDGAATREALNTHLRDADVLHLACHGSFRPDNPLSSALRLGDGWLTVRDAYELDLDGRLVTLSACETGISGLGPGDELIGFVRGFLSAGRPHWWSVCGRLTMRARASLWRTSCALTLWGRRRQCVACGAAMCTQSSRASILLGAFRGFRSLVNGAYSSTSREA